MALLVYSMYLGLACLCFEALLLWRLYSRAPASNRAEMTMVPSIALCVSSFAMSMFFDFNYIAGAASLLVLAAVGLTVVPLYRYLYARKARTQR